MIILRTIRSYYPEVTGPAKQAYLISRELGELGYYSRIYTTTPASSNRRPMESSEPFDIVRLPTTFRFMQYNVSMSFLSRLLGESFDIMHCHGYREYLTTIAALQSKIRRRPLVLQPHGTLVMYRHILPWRSWGPYMLFDWFTLKRFAMCADAVVVSTRQEAQEAKDFGLKGSRIRIIPTAAELVRPVALGSKREPIALFVGRITRDRNVHTIIEAFAEASRKVEMRLVIVGGEARRSSLEPGGYTGFLKALVASLGLEDQVVFTGPLFGADLQRRFSESSFFVYPSSYENFGQPLLEAAASGLPLLASPVGITSELVKEGETGYFVTPDNPQLLAQRMRELAEDLPRTRRMGRKLRTIVGGRYTLSKVTEQYRALYEELS